MAKKTPSRKVTPHRATGLSIKSLHGPTIFSAEITTDRNEYPSGKKHLYTVNRSDRPLTTLWHLALVLGTFARKQS
jgi:hypothetical protein